MWHSAFKKTRSYLGQDDVRICIALTSPYVILIVQYLVLIYFNLAETGTGYKIQLLSKVVVGLAFAYASPVFFRRSKLKAILIYFIAIFILLVNYLIFPENTQYLNSILFPVFFMSLPSFIYALSIYDFLIFKDVMKKASYIIFVIGIIIGLLAFTKTATIGSYSMALSYYMLFPALVSLDNFFDTFSLKSFAVIILSSLIIISLGSRGAILCIFIFVFLKFFFSRSKKTVSKLAISMVVLDIAIIALIFLEDIVKVLNNILISFGINSRTLLLMLREGVDLSGRDKVYANVIEETIKRPVLGIGITGDRRIIGGSYAHNIFIELIANFGFIVGFFIIAILMLLIIKSILVKNKEKYDLTIIWLSLGLIPLILSSSYLIKMEFWIFLGLIINISKSNIKKQLIIKEKYEKEG